MSPSRLSRDRDSAAAAATRLWRERKAGGLRVVQVQVFDHEIEELIRRRFLRASDAHDRVAIGNAVAGVLEVLCRGRPTR